MYVKGVGMTKFEVIDKPSHLMAYEAAYNSIEDSGLSINDIDAIVLGNMDVDTNGERQRHIPTILSSLFKKNIPIIRTPAACSSGGSALWVAGKIVENDESITNIMALGVEKLSPCSTFIVADELMMAADQQFEQPEGLIFPAQNALIAQQHFLRYGSNLDDLALIAFKNHENAFLNPKAMFYGKKISLEKIKSSSIVASPLRVFDCSITVNGGAACIISKDKSDVKISGSGLSVDYMATFEREDMVTWTATKKAAEDAYKQAGLQPKDIDLVEIHDAFTIVELISYEDLGFVEKGHGQDLIREGTVKLDGKLPVNTSGGLKAKGHPISPTGIAQVIEITEQLRGECKERQVSNARIGLAQNIGGAGGTAIVSILKKS
ncbi:MAG: thiolase family protein [Nanoarchaeota archaeon]|nr:thiolase family protein [Nanoarchaeota archaeon]